MARCSSSCRCLAVGLSKANVSIYVLNTQMEGMQYSLVEIAWYQVNEAGGGRRQGSVAARALGRGAIKDITAAISGDPLQLSRRVYSHDGGVWWQGLPSQGRLDDWQIRRRRFWCSNRCSWRRRNSLGAGEGGKGRDGQGGEEGRLQAWSRLRRRLLDLSVRGLHN